MTRFVPFLAVLSLLGVMAVAGCGSHGDAKPVSAPPQASPQVMAQQSADRAQQAAGGLAVMQQHMRQTGPPTSAPGNP